MDKVKVTIESKGDIKEFESDFVLMGGANIDNTKDGYPRVAFIGALMGDADILSLNRVYVSMGEMVHGQNIEEVYGVSREESLEKVRDIMPDVNDQKKV